MAVCADISANRHLVFNGLRLLRFDQKTL